MRSCGYVFRLGQGAWSIVQRLSQATHYGNVTPYLPPPNECDGDGLGSFQRCRS